MTINIYTDGSYDPAKAKGAYASLILFGVEKIILKDIIYNSTHNRMELLAVITALEYVSDNYKNVFTLNVYTDSQYVAGIPRRSQKLSENNFITAKGNTLPNHDLVQKLIGLCETLPVNFVKVKAHLKKTSEINYNIEVDKLVRSMVRDSEN